MALPPELIKKIRKIEIYSRKIVQSQLAGAYHSVFKGAGISFSEIRQYVAGDDVRSIDWNVTARMNDPFIKVFTEERDRTLTLIIDGSASTLFGSGPESKRDLITEIAALIAFSAIANQDRVGLLIFTDTVEKYVPPRRGRKHVMRILTEILSWKSKSSGTDVGAALKFFANVSNRPTVAFLMSDMQCDGWRDPLKLVSAKHDVVPIVIADPSELALPRVGVVPFQDMETGEVQFVNTSSRRARRMQQEQERAQAALKQSLAQLGCDYLHVVAGQSPVEALTKFFRVRERRASR